MNSLMNRRVEVIKVLAGKVKVKICILELLRTYGCLYLSDLRERLRKEKYIEISIGALHKYVKRMSEAGILKTDKGKNPNRLYIYISDSSIMDWVFQNVPSKKVSPDVIANILLYLEKTKKEWDKIVIRSKNKKIRLKEYVPQLVLMLTASGLEPFKTIVVLNKIGQKINKYGRYFA